MKEFKRFVDYQLRTGCIDDYEYVRSLTEEEYQDLLVNTWMKDPEMIRIFQETRCNIDNLIVIEYNFVKECCQ